MISRLGRIFNDSSAGVRGKLLGIYALLIATKHFDDMEVHR